MSETQSDEWYEEFWESINGSIETDDVDNGITAITILGELLNDCILRDGDYLVGDETRGRVWMSANDAHLMRRIQDAVDAANKD